MIRNTTTKNLKATAKPAGGAVGKPSAARGKRT
jgi:hypothetical protein